MAVQTPKKMDKYLKASELCDCEDFEIKNKAEELTENADSPKEAALNIFNFVRDEIPYGLDFCMVKASDTLEKRYGMCVTKTNLQIALLRAIGIPCRYHRVILSKDVLKGLIPDSFYDKIEDTIWYHPWCECYLSERWIACDAYMDKVLYEATLERGIFTKEQIPTIDWDGVNDLKTASAWILEDCETYSSYDDICKKVYNESESIVPKVVLENVMEFSNHYMNDIRNK